MICYRPSYEFTQTTTDYVFYDYIKLAYKQYKENAKGELIAPANK